VVSIVKALLLIGTYRNHAHRRERLRQAAAAATTPQRERDWWHSDGEGGIWNVPIYSDGANIR
jgi:D-alanyl-D-alanine dipeptidase